MEPVVVQRLSSGSLLSLAKRATISLRPLGIVGALFVVSMVVLNTGGTRTVAPHLFYLPIVASAYLYGPRGAVLTAAVAGILFCGPLMPLDARTWVEQSTIGWVLRTVSFVLVGGLTGVLINRLDSKVDELRVNNEQTIRAFVHTIDAKSPYTAVHSENVARYAASIGQEMGLGPKDLKRLKWAGLLHDIGKIAIPDEILNKPGKLTEEEWLAIKSHTLRSVEILREVDRFKPYLRVVAEHHERVDGRGYPYGLQGEDLSQDGKILAVADALEAMTP